MFDALINNGDRKGGHLLPTADGTIWGIDHGVSFAVEDKLRTVLWQWRGHPHPRAPCSTDDPETWLDEDDAGGRALSSFLRRVPGRWTRSTRVAPTRPAAGRRWPTPPAVAGLAGDPLAALLSRPR